MAVVSEHRPSRLAIVWEWLPIGVGLLLLYAMPLYDLATTLWSEDEYAHGPVILAVLFWLIWDRRAVLLDVSRQVARCLGLLCLAVGLVLYVLGRSQDITFITIGSLIPVLAGTLLVMRGRDGIASLWFALLFIVYLIPLPTAFVDGVTGSLKHHISEIAEQLLYLAGYPIARNGVTLTIGSYQLLVADACSGINSMFSLSAVGLLYLYLVRRRNWLHVGLIIGSLLPIAFCANVVRVIFLVLLTYHFGDAAGQGFLHGFSGMVLFVVALLLILAIDGILARALKPSTASSI